ncbi:peptidoglycan recognition protein family protein [Lentibacillus salinarum]|uniref:Autolysin n=1 Tax=Lentibacillus salinarum TaxID=446820 RepID=A0ABW3ZZE7_9BACI
MRKTVILVVSLLFIALFLPVIIFAEEHSNDTDGTEIEKGTEVYGEDISELSEEELQYIPKGWRDGEFESRHETEEDLDKEAQENFGKQTFSIMSVYPDVNDYIDNMDPVNVAYEHNSDFTEFNYRNGHGAVEGVVAHETANSHSTIRNEIDYMSRNHHNAFVHAFVDHNNIIEIHPTDLGAWGAGRHANERFVHVELVRVNTFDQFAKSINNYSDYIASILYKYNLGVTSADNNGKGTLWSHRAVSEHLGGTTHVDPHGYFAKWDYNWNDYVDLVTQKYNKLVQSKKANTSKLGRLKSSGAYLYDDPTDPNNRSKSGNENMKKVFFIKAEAKVNGNQYYLISDEPSSKRGTVGWVRGKDLKTHVHKAVNNKEKTLYFKGEGAAYKKAWDRSENKVYDDSDFADFKYEPFNIHKTETVGNNTWYRGYHNGEILWVHESHLTTREESKTSRLGQIEDEEATIYPDMDQPALTKKAGAEYTDSVYFIKKQMEVSEEKLYLISDDPSSKNGTIGWVNANVMKTHSHAGVDKKQKTFYFKEKDNINIYDRIWGGTGNLMTGDAQLQGQKLSVNLTEKVGKNNIWYRGKINGENVWIHESHLNKSEESSTSRLGQIKNPDINIYKELGNPDAVENAGNSRVDMVYFIKKQTKIGNKLYYLISEQPSVKNGTVGWVSSDDIETHTHKGVDKRKKTLYFKDKDNINVYDHAWGGAKDRRIESALLQGQKFSVNLTEKVGENNIWYRGEINGKSAWVHESHLNKSEESSTSRLGQIKNPEVNIYKEMGNPDAVENAGNSRVGKVYFIKKQTKIGSKLYYLISEEPSAKNGAVGWISSDDIKTHTHAGVDKKQKTFYIKDKDNIKAYDHAWGGAKDQMIEDVQLQGQEFNVHLTEKVGGTIWYRGELNDENVWVHESDLFQIEKSSTSRLGQIYNAEVSVYQDLTNFRSAEKAGSERTNKVYFIKEQAEVGEKLFYQVSEEPSSGTVGWINSSDIKTYSHAGVDKKKKTFNFKQKEHINIYDRVWGGIKNLKNEDAQLQGQKFKVNLTEKVGNNNMWYRGNLNDGEEVWVHESHLESQ